MVGVLAPVAVVFGAFGRVFPKSWLPGFSDAPFRRETSWVCLVIAGVIACLPHRTERYLVLIAPLLALATVAWIVELLAAIPTRSRRRRPAWPLAPILACAAPVAWFHYAKPGKGRPDLLAPVRSLGQAMVRAQEAHAAAGPGALSPGVFVDAGADPGFHVLGFVLFYGELPFRVQRLPREEPARQAALDAAGGGGETLVLCRGDGEFRWPATRFPDAEVIAAAPGTPWVVFRLAKPTPAREADP